MDIQEIKELSAYELATMADCASPDSPSSPGARMLAQTRDTVIEAWESGRYHGSEDPSDVHHAIADDAPSVYTYTAWQQFVDLGAWQEEPETGEWPDDLSKAAAVALYQIAERLAVAVHDELCEPASDAA